MIRRSGMAETDILQMDGDDTILIALSAGDRARVPFAV